MAEQVTEVLGTMDTGELVFIVGIGFGALMLMKTCFSMCAAIVNPPPDDAAVEPAGAPAAKLLEPDVEAGRGGRGPVAKKISPKVGSPKVGRKPKHHEPLQPLMPVRTGIESP